MWIKSGPDKTLGGRDQLTELRASSCPASPLVTDSLQEKDATLSAQKLQRSDSSQSRQQANPHQHQPPHTHIQSTPADSILRHKHMWTPLYQRPVRTLWIEQSHIESTAFTHKQDAHKRRHILFLQGLQLPVRGSPLPYLNQQVRAVTCKTCKEGCWRLIFNINLVSFDIKLSLEVVDWGLLRQHWNQLNWMQAKW